MDETLDLIRSLPQGSLFKGSLIPELEWTPERYFLANISDFLSLLVWQSAGCPEDRPTLIERPGDKARHEDQLKAEQERVSKVKTQLRQTEWEDI